MPDGLFRILGDTIQILAASRQTIAEYSRLEQILRTARQNRETPEAVAEKIRRETPGLAKLADLLVPKNAADFYGLLGALAATAALFVQLGQSEPDVGKITVNQVINQIVNGAAEKQPSRKADRSPKRPGRNDPCNCGSGKKYKKCCGALT